MQKAVEFLEKELSSLQVWRATTGLVDGINVTMDYGPTAMTNIARVFTLDAQTLKIEPYNKQDSAAITKAIFDADIGLTPQNNGDSIMITIPPLTKERREQIAKQVKQLGEEIKARLRKIRQEERDTVKKLFDAKEISEDQKKSDEWSIDDIIKEYNTKVDNHVKTKSDDVMKV